MSNTDIISPESAMQSPQPQQHQQQHIQSYSIETNDQTGGDAMSTKSHNEYDTRTLSDTVIITPASLNMGKTIDELVKDRLCAKVEGRCISDGYVRPESVDIISRSLGCMENNDFDANMAFAVSYNCQVCNPKQGQIMECTVDIADDTNIVCYIGDEETSPVEIYLFKENHVGDATFSSLRPGDSVRAAIIETVVEFGKPKVLATAQFLTKVE